MVSENGGVVAFRLSGRPHRVESEATVISTGETVRYYLEWIVSCRLRNLDGVMKKVRVQFLVSQAIKGQRGWVGTRWDESVFCLKPRQRRTVSGSVLIPERWEERGRKDPNLYFEPEVKIYEAIPEPCTKE